MKITKEQAKQQIEVYGALLEQRGVISDISQEEVRGEIRYSFEILERFDFPYPVECVGVKELALVLTCMWYSYAKAQDELGLTDREQYI